MAKDEVEWDAAHVKFREIEKANMSGMMLATLPYKAGIILALSSAIATVAMKLIFCSRRPDFKVTRRNL